MDELEARLINNTIQPTAVRLLVLKYLLAQNRAVSLKDIEQNFDYADKSTLFRTLKTFEKNKLIHRVNDGSKQPKFALSIQNQQAKKLHYHFYCEKCNNTYCLEDEKLLTIKLPQGFLLKEADMIVKGICKYC